MTKEELQDLLFECYNDGVSYWQLIMEEERETEETFDAFIWVQIANKYCMPSHSAERRQLHSEEWFKVKRREAKHFYSILASILR